MPSPFPGMDPMIESQKWTDFHTRFIGAISDAIVPRVRPNYVVEIERRVYVEKPSTDDPVNFVADVAVSQSPMKPPKTTATSSETSTNIAVAEEVRIEPALGTLAVSSEHREARLVLRRTSDTLVVTVIELLSPTNKRTGSNGRQVYLDKRDELLHTSTSLVELDLLRGGEPMPAGNKPEGDYSAIVSRPYRRPTIEIYAWPLRHRLPVIPIPLSKGDPDVEINLQAIFNQVYERAGYDYSIDYQTTIQPPLTEEDQKWWDAERSRM